MAVVVTSGRRPHPRFLVGGPLSDDRDGGIHAEPESSVNPESGAAFHGVGC